NTTNTTRAARTTGLSDTASTTCAARTAGSSGGSTVLVSGCLISVWRVAAMLRVVLPVLVCAVDVVLLVVVVYVLVVDVHVHVPVVPAAVVAPTATPGRAEGESRSECQRRTGDVSRISDRGVRIRRSTVNSRGVIRRYVNRVGISGLNHDRLLTAVDRLGFNFLLRACLYCSGALSFRPHALDCGHHVSLLRQESVSKIRRPLNVACERFHDIREWSQTLNARVP